MKMDHLMRATCDMCGEEVLIESFDYESISEWYEKYDVGASQSSQDFCPICASKIENCIREENEYLREHGQIKENDERAIADDHGGLVKKRENGVCEFADGFVLFPCTLCNDAVLKLNVNDQIEKKWTVYEKKDRQILLCGDCSSTVDTFIRTETTGNLAHMKKALARFAKPE